MRQQNCEHQAAFTIRNITFHHAPLSPWPPAHAPLVQTNYSELWEIKDETHQRTLTHEGLSPWECCARVLVVRQTNCTLAIFCDDADNISLLSQHFHLLFHRHQMKTSLFLFLHLEFVVCTEDTVFRKIIFFLFFSFKIHCIYCQAQKRDVSFVVVCCLLFL